MLKKGFCSLVVAFIVFSLFIIPANYAQEQDDLTDLEFNSLIVLDDILERKEQNGSRFNDSIEKEGRYVAFDNAMIEQYFDISNHGEEASLEIWKQYLDRLHPDIITLERYFEEASAEFGVPVELLHAIGQVESNWTQLGPSIDKGWGIMHLVQNNYCNTLSEAAALIELEEQVLKDCAKANIRGAAALIADYAGPGRKNFKNIEDWFNAVKRFSGLATEELRHNQVVEYYKILKTGVEARTLWNEYVSIEANPEISLSPLIKDKKILQSADYPGAILNLTPYNFWDWRDHDIDTIVLHWIGTGTYNGAISWFHNQDAQASAHFVIRNFDGEITQVVRTHHTAWHAGATGYPYNNRRSIGVEHEATLANPDQWYSMPMLEASTDLAEFFAGLHGIPKQRSLPGIQGHNDMPGTNTKCPGNLPWDLWLGMLNDDGSECSVTLLNPPDGATISFPYTFEWSVEGNCSDFEVAILNVNDNEGRFFEWTGTSVNITKEAWDLIVDEIGSSSEYAWGIRKDGTTISNVHTFSVEETGDRDLIVKSLNVQPKYSKVGDKLEAKVVIENRGDADVTDSFWVDFYEDEVTAPAPHQEGEHYKQVASLPAGGTEVVTFSFTPDQAGTYRAWVQVDVFEDIGNSDVAGPVEYVVENPGADCSVSVPDVPSGNESGKPGESYTYTTGGAECDAGYPIEYRFDWGDGSYSDWATAADASNSWDEAGTYQVRAQARCTEDFSATSEWSDTLTVTIEDLKGSLPVPTLIKPADNATVAGSFVEFQWGIDSGTTYTGDNNQGSSNALNNSKQFARPEIKLSEVPDQAMEKDKLHIKFTPVMSSYLDERIFTQSADGILTTGIEDIDLLNSKYEVTEFIPMFNNTYEISTASKEYEDRHREAGLHLWYEIQVKTNKDIREVVKDYNNSLSINIAEPVYKIKIVSNVNSEEINQAANDGNVDLSNEDSFDLLSGWTPDDPKFSDQWHYHNTGQHWGTEGKDIDLLRAWEIEKGSPDVLVAVLDSGIQHDHPDLEGNMCSEIGYNFVSDTSTIYRHNHGTHVAGTVAAVSNNNLGVAGIAGGSGAGNSGVRLLSCQIFEPDPIDNWNAGDEDLNSGGTADALIYAADQGAAIAQNSWSFRFPGIYSNVILDAIDYFNDYGGGDVLDGGLTIFAAGNSNDDADYYPAYYEGTIAVAATNNRDQKAYYSNYGSWVDISAPGGELSSFNDPRGVKSTNANFEYSYKQGTSMACPHVSGVAALIISNAPGQFTAQEIKAMLLETTDNHYADNPGYTGQLGTGRLNAYQALLSVQTPGVTRYELEVLNMDGTTLKHEELGNVTSHALSGFPADDTPYEWRVRAGSDTAWGEWSNPSSFNNTEDLEEKPPCSIKDPGIPAGESAGKPNTSYSYTTGGSTCEAGHVVEYRFDWGDGSYSDWSTAADASNSWSSEGTYEIRALARCQDDPSVTSNWSNALTVTIFTSTEPSFTDVPNDHFFFKEIETLVEYGISEGYEDGTFRPSEEVNRMATAAFLVRGFVLDQSYELPAVASFTDVSTDHPFYEEIELLAASKITTGYDDGTFRPSVTVNRMATAAFLVRALELDKNYAVPAEPSFTDVSTDHPFYEEIELLAASKITTGYDDGTFRPSASVSRMAMAAFLVRGLNLDK